MAGNKSGLTNGNMVYDGKEITIQDYRNSILVRNLYNFDNDYVEGTINEKLISASVSSILSVIPQFNSLQTQLSLANNIINPTPLTEIGIVMLGRQMYYNSAMNLSTKYLPIIDTSQILKGNLKGIFKKNKDNSITVENKDDTSFLDKVGSGLSNFLGIDTYDVFGTSNPFKENPTNLDYIKNTGDAQLSRFFSAINKNLYKPINTTGGKSSEGTAIIEYGDKVGVPVDTSRKQILYKKPSFTFDNSINYPYLNIRINPNAIVLANESMWNSLLNNPDVQEYAPTPDYIRYNFGGTTPAISNTPDDFVSNGYQLNNTNGDIVWGRDGVGDEALERIKYLRGDDDKNIVENDDIFKTLKIKEGILEYTRNLLNATSGQFVDITRKIYDNEDGVVGFQGSGLWRANNSTYSVASNNSDGTVGKQGVRQHTILDPYARASKLIRFKGNKVYEGNTDSITYKSVLPRIHPTKNDKIEGGIDNKNLMFSIENLAIGTIKRDKYGVIDDEYGSPIPLEEVGQFGGRLMWFPPYGISIVENAIANYESTVMVGRNEPMYNYMHSERTATVSFSLLVDFPEQLRNVNLRGEEKNKAIADFFAFGGDPLVKEYQTEQLEKDIEELKGKIPVIENPSIPAPIPEMSFVPINAYFQNDFPTTNEVTNAFNIMYGNPNHYEIINGFNSAQDENGWGLNQDIYYITGITEFNGKYLLNDAGIDQYSLIGETDEYNGPVLNFILNTLYGDENTRDYYDIDIVGRTSVLYLTKGEKEYNEALGLRRAEAVKELILSRLNVMFGATFANEFKNRIFISTSGSVGASAAGADPKTIHNKAIKEERSASITIRRNNKSAPKIEKAIPQTDVDNIAKINEEIRVKEKELKKLKNMGADNVFEERTDLNFNLNDFEYSAKNVYAPAYNSQTPEDIHKRLTFLHQCTRQGSAKRYDIIDEKGELRARNSVFGKQPICILRIGDFFNTKVVIKNVTIDYGEIMWDLNPESFGVQPMMANVTLQMAVIGGQSLKGPIDALQNAVTFNYYANSTFSDKGIYKRPSIEADNQSEYINGVVTKKQKVLNDKYNELLRKNVSEGEK